MLRRDIATLIVTSQRVADIRDSLQGGSLDHKLLNAAYETITAVVKLHEQELFTDE